MPLRRLSNRGTLIVALASVSTALLLILTFATGAHADRTALSKPPNNLGLVGYWSFDDGAGTTATDFSGNGNHGALMNMEAANWTDGRLGRALTFDGENDYISVGKNALGNLGDESTVSAWVQSTASGQQREIISEYQAGVCGDYSLRLVNGKLYVHDGGGASVNSVGNTLNDGQWHHVVAVSETTGTKIYIDGSLDVSSATDVDWRNSCTNQTVEIGRRMDGGNIFAGSIDEVRIYNRALAPAEIERLYRAGTVRLGASSAELHQGSSLERGLVGHWTFDGGDTDWTSDTSGTTADRSGNSNTGTLTSMNRRTSVEGGALGQALNFDGTDDYIGLNFTNSFPGMSLSFWANPSLTQSTFPRVIGVSGTRDHELVGSSDAYRFRYGNSTSVDSDAGFFVRGEWNYYTVTYDLDTVSFYRNGILHSEKSASRTEADATIITIGKSGGSNNQYWNGLLDDFRIYNRALSPDEVKQLYNLGHAVITH